jgi:hypothetical protein
VFDNKAAHDPAPSATFVGLGDTLTANSLTAVFAYSLQAFSAATRGNRVVNLCNSTGGVDVTCADASTSATTGLLVIPGTLTAFCPGSFCTINTWYDLVGTNCSGSCDINEGTIANRAVLTASAVGTYACGKFPGLVEASPTLGTSFPQPFGLVAVAERTANFTTTMGVIGDSTSGSTVGFNNAANQATDYSNGGQINSATTVTDSAPHVMQGLFNGNGTSSNIYVDGTAVAGALGTASMAGNIRWGQDTFSNFFTGYACEGAAFTGSAANISAAQSAINSRLHSNWGF